MSLRLGLLSNEALSPWINWTTLSPPLYRAFTRLGPTEIIAPPPARSFDLKGLAGAVRSSYASNTLFGMQASARLETTLMLVSLARGLVRRTAFVVDPWRQVLDRIDLSARAQFLHRVFIPYHEAFDLLSARNPERYVYLPFGIDTDVFASHAPERDVDIFWMGRRYEPLHRAILDYSERNGLNYLFRERVGFIKDPMELGRIASRSRYFVATPPDLDDSSRTGGFSPLVMRYLEGLSAGCRLLGVLPHSGEFQEFLPRQSILEVKADGSDFAACFEEDRDNRVGWTASEQARRIVREKHSWVNRAEQIWRVLAQEETSFDFRAECALAPVKPVSTAA